MNKRNIFVLMIALLALLGLCLTACDGGNGADTESDGSAVGAQSSFGVVYNGKTIKLGSTKAQMTEALGEPVSSEAAGTCGKQGTLHRYGFSSLTVEVLDSGDGGTVDYISLNDDLVTTDKNIRIGSSKDDVVSAYGEPSADDGNNIRYNEGNFTLKFGIGDNKVTSITLIRTTAE